MRRLTQVTLTALMSSASTAFAACDLSAAALYAGEESDVILCIEGSQSDASVSFDKSGLVELEYLQPLKRCGVDDKRGGFHIVLKSLEQGSVTLQLNHADQLLCEAALQIQAARDVTQPEWLDAMPVQDARYIDVRGIRTRYFDKGEGQPIVLVHGGQAGGANNSAQKWEQNFDALAETYRVIALDRLAQAGTDNLPKADDYVTYFERDARHLQDFLLALELENAILVGHSQGGWPVTRVALDRPDLVSCLVNVDTVLVPDDMSLMREALSFILYTDRFVDPPEGPTVHSARRAMALRYPSGNNITQAKAERVVEQFRSSKTAIAREHMAAQRMNPRHPAFAALREQVYEDIGAGHLRARSLVIWGEQDPQVPLGMGRQFQALLEAANVDSTLSIIKGAGHAPFIEFPGEFNGRIIDFCGANSVKITDQ